MYTLYRTIAVMLMTAMSMLQAPMFGELTTWPVCIADTSVTVDNVTVDISDMDDGLITVDKIKDTHEEVIVTTKPINIDNAKEVAYKLEPNRTHSVLPLQYGTGQYTVQVVRIDPKTGWRKSLKRATVNVEVDDKYAAFLKPTHYVWYNKNSPVTEAALSLTQGKIMSDKEICEAARAYMRRYFVYDYVRAKNLAEDKNIFIVNHMNMYKPLIDEPFETHMGVCMDLSAIMAAMLRINGIPAMLTVGWADKNCHAWVTAVVDGKETIYDPTADIFDVTFTNYEEVQRY